MSVVFVPVCKVEHSCNGSQANDCIFIYFNSIHAARFKKINAWSRVHYLFFLHINIKIFYIVYFLF